MLARIYCSNAFSKHGMKQAYNQQILLDDDSKKYVVVHIHRGLFCYTRLVFRISSADTIFKE